MDESSEWMTKLGWLRYRFPNQGSCGKKGSKGKSRSIEAKFAFLRRHFFASFPPTTRRFSESWWGILIEDDDAGGKYFWMSIFKEYKVEIVAETISWLPIHVSKY